MREFDGGVECISEINEVAEFFFRAEVHTEKNVIEKPLPDDRFLWAGC